MYIIDWQEKQAWVGVFDILGFKNLTKDEFQRKLLKSKLNDVLKELNSDAVQHGQLECKIFADTIVIFAPDTQDRSYPWFVSECQNLQRRSIECELPLRGAISVGTYFINTDPLMIFGEAFIEAFEYCEDQDWLGLLLTPSATKKIIAEMGLNPYGHGFVKDTIPLRKKPSEDVLAYCPYINGWTNWDILQNPMYRLQQMQKVAPDDYTKQKYNTTMEFIKKHVINFQIQNGVGFYGSKNEIQQVTAK